MDRAHWRSPSFRGRSPHPRHSNPRFRGDGNNFGTPRHFSPQWQQRSPSPYRYQSQQVPGGGGGFSPQFHHGHHPYASTPIHGSGGGRRPYFRGGGRFNKRQSFGSQSFGKGTSGGSEDIEQWVSPEMWADPWRFLTDSASASSAQISRNESEQGATKLAESDFNITQSSSESFNQNTQGTSNTKFADSDFNVTNSPGGNISQQAEKPISCTATTVTNPSVKLDENEIDLGDDDDDDDATDRVVYENEDELLS